LKLGAISFMTDYSIPPAEVARELEAHGFESFWAGDHPHIPVPPKSDGPVLDTRTGEPLQTEYWHLMDPFLALTSAATATTRILLGTGVCLINERDPILTAKEVATLDHISGGRFIFGIGGGWNEPEMRNHGTDPKSRWRLMRERVAAMKTIWSQDEAEFHGEFVNFTPLMSWPKPIQRPHPPILIGGGDGNLARVIEYADGWCPGTIRLPEGALQSQITELQRRASEAGRQPLPVTAFHIPPVANLRVGSDLELSEKQWESYAMAGVSRLVVMLPPWREHILPLIERYARFTRQA
jgi:probable F420-dependent oxidoreductase